MDIESSPWMVWSFSYRLEIGKFYLDYVRHIDIAKPSVVVCEDEIDAFIVLDFPRRELLSPSSEHHKYCFDEVKEGVPELTTSQITPNDELLQLIEFMGNQEWEYIRVVFLSDLVAENRTKFKAIHHKVKKSPLKVPISLFDDFFNEDLETTILDPNPTMVKAWGETYPLHREAMLLQSIYPNAVGVEYDKGFERFGGKNVRSSEKFFKKLSDKIPAEMAIDEDLPVVRIW